MTPGSSIARKEGCCCPEKENGYGTGPEPIERPNIFVIDAKCTVHGIARWGKPFLPPIRSENDER